MAHYAILDDDNKVVDVVVGKNEGELSANGELIDWELYYKGKRTSYNTRGGEHLTGGQPFRKNYAGVGFVYDAQRDAFVPPKPFNSWVLNEQTCLWESPVAYPQDGKTRVWNELNLSWDEVAE